MPMPTLPLNNEALSSTLFFCPFISLKCPSGYLTKVNVARNQINILDIEHDKPLPLTKKALTYKVANMYVYVHITP